MPNSSQALYNSTTDLVGLAHALELAASNRKWSAVGELIAGMSSGLNKTFHLLKQLSVEDATRCGIYYERLSTELMEQYGERLGMKEENIEPVQKISEIGQGEIAHEPVKKIMKKSGLRPKKKAKKKQGD